MPTARACRHGLIPGDTPSLISCSLPLPHLISLLESTYITQSVIPKASPLYSSPSGQQAKLERALAPILSKPPSIHQSATVSALTTANIALVTCRQTLRYVYIAKYFIPEKCPLLDIFQKNHDDFESHTGAYTLSRNVSIHLYLMRIPSTLYQYCTNISPTHYYCLPQRH